MIGLERDKVKWKAHLMAHSFELKKKILPKPLLQG